MDPEPAGAFRPHRVASGALTTPASSPRVSVLVTAFNRETYIAEALESVLAQTMTDFEVIVCDDQSTDGTVRVVEQIARRDSRVRLSVNARTLGDYGNRRRASRPNMWRRTTRGRYRSCCTGRSSARWSGSSES